MAPWSLTGAEPHARPVETADLIRACSDGHDGYGSAGDGNGFVDDIAGWDFQDDDNDPFDDVDYGHGTGQAIDGTAEANNGGGFPGTIGRIEHGYLVRPDLCAVSKCKNPRSYLGKFYVDSLVHDPAALRSLLDLVGPKRIALGSPA